MVPARSIAFEGRRSSRPLVVQRRLHEPNSRLIPTTEHYTITCQIELIGD